MEIQVLDKTQPTTYPNLEQIMTFYSIQCGKHSAEVGVSRNLDGSFNHVDVLYHNASTRVWRGLGKRFYKIDDAVAHYKKGEIKAMIQFAVGVA